MSHSLILVESTAKCRALIHNLDDSYEILSLTWHFNFSNQVGKDIDLPHDLVIFEPDCIEQMLSAAAKADAVYLAFDPDRQGDTLAHYANQVLANAKIAARRILFNEMSRNAILAAVQKNKPVRSDTVHAYWANRLLDSYFCSRVNKIEEKNGLPKSACGRREYVILNFLRNPQSTHGHLSGSEPWQIQGVFQTPKIQPFAAPLLQVKGAFAKIPDQHHAKVFIADLKKQKYTVSAFHQCEIQNVPPPPFQTLTLLAEACQVLSFPSNETIRLVRELYEGIDLGKGRVEGLVTFYNTSSEKVSEQALTEARELILIDFGKDYLAAKPRYGKSKSDKSMLETIRPVSIKKTPRKMKRYLSDRQYQLYSLIWSRYVASQMVSAKLRQTTIEIAAAENRFLFGIQETVPNFRGFLQAYPEQPSHYDSKDLGLPGELRIKGEVELKDVILQKVNDIKNISESDVITFFEKNQLPYDSEPIRWLIDNNYVDQEDHFLIPTQLAHKVSSICLENAELTNMEMLRKIEQEICLVEAGEKDFHSMMQNAVNMIQSCKLLSKGSGKSKASAEACPLCGGALVPKKGKYGAFTACSRYPQCLYTRSVSLNIRCPVVGCGGEVVERRSKIGRLFYGCSYYPKCNFVSWKKPVNKECPQCGHFHLVVYGQQGDIMVYQCPNCKKKVKEEAKAQ